MRTWKLLVGAWVALAVATAAWAARPPAPMLKYENNPVQSFDGKPLSLEQVRKAIIQGGAMHQWLASQQPNNVIRLSHTRDRYTAVVDVAYSQTEYSIRYVTSAELNYSPEGGGMIHPTYNNWMKNLKNAIDAAMRTV